MGMSWTAGASEARPRFWKGWIFGNVTPCESAVAAMLCRRSPKHGSHSSGFMGNLKSNLVSFCLLEFLQLLDQVAQLLAILALHGWHLRRGFRHNKRVGNPFLFQQEIHIPENRFGRIGTQRPSLAKGEIGLTRHALLFRGTGGLFHAPGVKSAVRTPQFGKHPVGIGILDETRIAAETAEILFPKGLFGERGDFPDRRVIVQPVANHRPDKAPPIIVVLLDD